MQQGLAPLTEVVRGDFLNMPFKDNTFDGAYAIEATCHAPTVRRCPYRPRLLKRPTWVAVGLPRPFTCLGPCPAVPCPVISTVLLTASPSWVACHGHMRYTSCWRTPGRYALHLSLVGASLVLRPIPLSCHLPMALQLESVYGEIFRVLKPGSYFVSYEWVSTNKFDPNNAQHVKIIDEINFGNGLPVSHAPSACAYRVTVPHLGSGRCKAGHDACLAP